MRLFSAENNISPQAILLLDNCSAHTPIESLCSDDGKIFAMLLPPNVTAVIQPMDQNPIKITKLKYRNMLLSSIVGQEDVSVHDLLRNHSLRDAILLLSLAWNELPQSVLIKSWSKILNWDDSQWDEEDDIPLSELFPSANVYRIGIQETKQLLSKLAVDCNLSTDEIEEWNADKVDFEDVEDLECDEAASDSEAVCQHPPVLYSDALNAVNTLIKWTEYNTEYSNKHFANLVNLRADIVKKQFDKQTKQSVLTDFFSKN